MLNEELLEALCQKTELFCGPWGRLLQYPQLRTYQKSVKSVVVYSDSPHSFHIVPHGSTILFDFDSIPMASQWHPNGIPMASQWHPKHSPCGSPQLFTAPWYHLSSAHASLPLVAASHRCSNHRQKMISLLPNDVNLPGWRKIHPRLSFSSFQHSPGLTPMTTSFALETPNLHPLTCPAGRINHTRHTENTGSNVLSSWSSWQHVHIYPA